MPSHPRRPTDSVAGARATLADRLRARRSEIEQVILRRVHEIADPTGIPDPEYIPGLRRAVSAAVDHSFLNVEIGEQQLLPIPMPLLSQARLAARNGVGLNTLHQRCVESHILLIDFIEKEAQNDCSHRGELATLRSSQVALLHRLISALSDGHARGDRDCPGSPQAVLRQRVRRLLAGELADTSEIPYDFEGYHVGVLTKGPEAIEALRNLARTFDSRLLLAEADDDIAWAWLGTRSKIDQRRLNRHVTSAWPQAVPLALGETAEGLIGWRLTHRQARAAFSLAQQRPNWVARYADVALLASMAQDDLLITSLRTLYLAPLADERDGGKVLRDTLRTYFASGRNNSATAAALGVNRQTIANRLQLIEKRIGMPLPACEANVEAALRLVDVGPTLHSC